MSQARGIMRLCGLPIGTTFMRSIQHVALVELADITVPARAAIGHSCEL